MFIAILSSFPIKDYDYHIIENTISPVTAAMGGMNVTNIDDCALLYNNVALLSYLKYSTMQLSARVNLDEEQSFSEILHFSNTLKQTIINYFSFTIDTGGFAYQPLANVHQNRTWGDSIQYKEYEDYQLSSYQIGISEKNDYLSYGLNLKYLSGRLVYLKEHSYDDNWLKDDFIDDKVNGFSADLSFSIMKDHYAYGLNLYDVFSKLWWRDNPNKNLVRRAAFGTQIMRNGNIYMSGVSSRLELDTQHLYHFGIQRTLIAKGRAIPIRMGAYSRKFAYADEIFISFGMGYYIGQTFRIDISATNNGFDLNKAKYLLSFSLKIVE
ncbi:MAG: hypothetical protein U9N34_08545 [Candidatus Cloacimonadota bacterium]|nr:hypothetical protein [Candidatus Cloacimonadota bacterium]